MICFNLGGNGFITATVDQRARKTGPGSCQVRNNKLELKQE